MAMLQVVRKPEDQDQAHAGAKDDPAIMLAHSRSATDPRRVHWVQLSWQGRGRTPRCWRWAGYILGSKATTITWIAGRGYCARASGRSVGAFTTLAEAQDEAMFAATEPAFVLADLFAGIGEFMTRWRDLLARQEQERRAMLAEALPQIATFNANWSARGRGRRSAAA